MKTSELGEVFMKDHMDSITSDRSAAEHPAPRTPLTDAVFDELIDSGADFTRPANVMDRHARRMERDRAELAEKLEALIADCESGWGDPHTLDSARTALQKVKP